MKYTRKLQYGGLVLYQPTPISPSMPTAPSQGAVGASDKQGSSWLDEDLIKEIIDVGGLTNETNEVLASLMSIEGPNPFLQSSNRRNYIAYASKINELKQNKEMWKRSYELAKASGGLGEVAVGTSGELYVQDSEGNIKTASIAEYKKNSDKYRALSVAELLEQRNSNPDLAGVNNIFNVADTSIGMEKISNYARQIVAALGTEKETNRNIYDRDDLAARLSNASIEIQSTNRVPTSEEIKGFAILENIQNNPSKYNEIITESSSSRNHALKAVKYIWNTLGRDAQNKLSAQAAINDTTPSEMLLDLVILGTNKSEFMSIKPVSEEMAKTGTSGESMTGAKNMNNIQTMLKGTFATGKRMTYNDPEYASKFEGLVLGSVPTTAVDGSPTGPTTLTGLLKAGGHENYVDTNNLYFGNKKLQLWHWEKIVVDGRSDIAHVLLPVDKHGNPDNASLEMFKSVMDEYNANKDNMSRIDIQKLFNNAGFQVKINDDKSLDVRKVGSDVKPFLIVTGYTNNVVRDLIEDNDDPESGGIRKLDRGENANLKDLIKSGWKIGSGKNAVDIEPTSFWRDESLYKGMIYMRLRDNYTVRADSMLGDGPKHPAYTAEQVMYHNQNTSGNSFISTSVSDLNR